MFTLHERTRMICCRLGFLILCVVPTLFVAGFAWRYRSPKYLEAQREEWQAVLSDKLGLDVSIAQLSYPTWNTALLEEVSLTDAETQRQWVATRYIELLFAEGTWRIVAGQPEIDATALPQLRELVQERLLRGQAVKLGPLSFSAGEVTFHNATQSQTLRDVSALIVNGEHGKRVQVHFNIAGITTKKPLELVIERRRDESHPRTLTTFHTAESDVPLDALQPLFPWLETLGSNALFHGAIGLESDNAGTSLEVAGQFKRVDLERLTADRLPHYKLTGQADIALDMLQMKRGAIALAKGTVRTQGGGEVSRSLLEALGQRLDLAPKQLPLANPQQRVRYSHLAFGFQLDAAGLAISGGADPAREGVIMASAAAGPLLIESEQSVVPAVFLIQALSPRSDMQLPATPEAKSWFDLLPPPALLPPEEVSTARPNLNLRLRKQ